MRVWLDREDLNRFDLQLGKAEISSIFKFFKEDFGTESELRAILAKFAPPEYRQLLETGKLEIDYRPCHWGLNDQGGRGKDYKRGLLKRIFG